MGIPSGDGLASMKNGSRSRKLKLLALTASAVCCVLLFLASQSSGEDFAGTEELEQSTTELAGGDFQWGTTNPATGMMRVDCGSNIARDTRFHGNVGDSYTVECPAHCAHYGAPVYGCETFMDPTSICRAAIARRTLGHQNSGIVHFKLVEPIKKYPACVGMPTEPGTPYAEDTKMYTVTSSAYTWHNWHKAARADKIKKYGKAGAIQKYRTHWAGDHRYGLRAFVVTDGESNVCLLNTPEKKGWVKLDGAKAKNLFEAVPAAGGNASPGSSPSPSKNASPSPQYSADGTGPHPVEGGANGLTVEVWVKDTLIKETSGYISAGASISADRIHDENGFFLGTWKGAFAFGLATTATKRMTIVSAPEWLTLNNKDKWTHIAGTYDGQEMKLYINGVFVACAETQNGAVSYTTSGIVALSALHNKAGNSASVFIGELDEVRVWNVALSGAGIRSRMGYTIQEPFSPSLKYYFRFDGQDPATHSLCSETPGFDSSRVGDIELADSGAPVEMRSETTRCKVDLVPH